VAVSGRRRSWHKVPLFAFSLATFVVGIYLMKTSAAALGPLLQGRFAIGGFVDGLGFGLLVSYLIMSGSPVAGAAMALLDAGVVDSTAAYGIVVGSRFGGSFIVLFIGFIYVLKGRDRRTSLSMGMLALLVAGTIQMPAIPLGLWLVSSKALEGWRPAIGDGAAHAVDRWLGPLADGLMRWLPEWAVFAVGLVVIFASFRLFDLSLPQMSLKESPVGQLGAFVYRPSVMFILGAAVTLISMSVSISLGLLVPLSQRGLVRRENVVPYMMGANVTTFVDTVLAALLIGNPEAMGVIASAMLSLAMVSAAVLLLGLNAYERALLATVDCILESTWRLAMFMLVILLVPLVFLLR